MVNTRNFPPVAIVAGVRTPFVRSMGRLRDTGADDLGAACLRELVQRSGVNPAGVDEVIVGCVGQPVDAMNIARVIALRAGFPVSVPACTVHRNCASSFESVTTAWERIATGQAEVVVAGGAESMSNMPVMADRQYVRLLETVMGAKSRWQRFRALLGFRPSMLRVHPAILQGLTDKTCGQIMGMTAENLARDFRIPRDDQDAYALESHRRLTRAWADNRLCEEVMPMYPAPDRKPLTQDVGYRPNQTMDALAKLKPYFDRKYGSVTVGNSCPITDGAVMLLMMPLERAKAEGREVLGVLESFAYSGLQPDRMGLGPVFSSSKALADAGMTLQDIDLIELNEAFAAQVLACLRAFDSDTFARERLGRDRAMGEVDRTRLNVNGGAIAMGHPVGATGGRLVLTLLREMQSRNLERGLATLCIGGGMGGAIVLSRDVDQTRPKRFPTAGELVPENGNGTAATAAEPDETTSAAEPDETTSAAEPDETTSAAEPGEPGVSAPGGEPPASKPAETQPDTPAAETHEPGEPDTPTDQAVESGHTAEPEAASEPPAEERPVDAPPDDTTAVLEDEAESEGSREDSSAELPESGAAATPAPGTSVPDSPSLPTDETAETSETSETSETAATGEAAPTGEATETRPPEGDTTDSGDEPKTNDPPAGDD